MGHHEAANRLRNERRHASFWGCARGTANTRWRDFVDLYALAMRHPVNGATFKAALDRVAQYRKVTLCRTEIPLDEVFDSAKQRFRVTIVRLALATLRFLYSSIDVYKSL